MTPEDKRIPNELAATHWTARLPDLPVGDKAAQVGPATIQYSNSSRHACHLNCDSTSLTATQAEELAGYLAAFAVESRAAHDAEVAELALVITRNGVSDTTRAHSIATAILLGGWKREATT